MIGGMKMYTKTTNCNITTCRYNENGKCTNEEKRKECVEVSEKVLVDRLSPSELLMYMSDGIGNVETLKKFGIEINNITD